MSERMPKSIKQINPTSNKLFMSYMDFVSKQVQEAMKQGISIEGRVINDGGVVVFETRKPGKYKIDR